MPTEVRVTLEEQRAFPMRVSILLAALCAASPVLAQTSWVQSPVNGRWYRLTAAQTWNAAEAEAVREGGHLATIRNRDEHLWAVGQFGNRQMWIGLNDAAVEGSFVWSSGEPVTYTNFCPNEPNGRLGEDYVHIAWWCLGEPGGWNDQQGTDLYAGLIEVAAAPNGWVQSPVNGRWYRTTDPKTWLDARSEALADGAELVTVRSQAEMDWIVQQFGSRELWTGLNDAASEGSFVWASGEPLGYTNWCAGQPDGGPGIDAVRLSAACGLAGGWDDDDASRLFGGLLERVTAPGSVFTPVGSGCAGSAGVPVLDARFGSVLRLDARFDLVATNLPQIPIAVPFGLLGFSDQAWDGFPLPFDLGSIGMSGCSLYNDIAVATLLYRDRSTASWSLRVPNMAVLLGIEAFFQVLVLDPGANAFGGVMTNGGRATIGN
jgi:hypothetical protein